MPSEQLNMGDVGSVAPKYSDHDKERQASDRGTQYAMCDLCGQEYQGQALDDLKLIQQIEGGRIVECVECSSEILIESEPSSEVSDAFDF